MAAAASIGSNLIAKIGYRIPAATGIRIALQKNAQNKFCLIFVIVALDNLNISIEGAEVGTIFINTSTKDVFRCVSASEGEHVWAYMANISKATPSMQYLTSENCSTYSKIVRAENYFTVSFDADGGTGGTTNMVVSVGFIVPSITIPTKTGYTFLGYYLGETKYFDEAGNYVIK